MSVDIGGKPHVTRSAFSFTGSPIPCLLYTSTGTRLLQLPPPQSHRLKMDQQGSHSGTRTVSYTHLDVYKRQAVSSVLDMDDQMSCA